MRKPFANDWKLTQGFAENPQIYAQFNLKGHNGTDWGLPTGTEIVAPHSGKVVEATNNPTGYGLYLKIESATEGSVLAHLKEFKVKVGDQVTEGQLVAISDNTGFSTGPHLHWGYYRIPRDRANGYGGFIDPFPFLTAAPAPTDQGLIDQLRAERDKNWTLYQESVKQTELHTARISELEGTVTTKNEEIKKIQMENITLQDRLFNMAKAIEADAVEDRDTSRELVKVSSQRDDLIKDMETIGDRLNTLPNVTDILGAIEKLTRPIEEAVKPVAAELAKANKVLEEDFTYKRTPKKKGFWVELYQKVTSIFRWPSWPLQ